MCSSVLVKKIKRAVPKWQSGIGELSPESKAYLARLEKAVCSFIRRLGFVHKSNRPSAKSTIVFKATKDQDTMSVQIETNGGTSRKRPLSTPVLPTQSSTTASRMTTNLGTTPQTNTVAGEPFRKAFRSKYRIENLLFGNNGPCLTVYRSIHCE